MKSKIHILLLSIIALVLVQGCVALPPLIHVEHKDANNNNNQELIHRLDMIDQRLARLEQREGK